MKTRLSVFPTVPLITQLLNTLVRFSTHYKSASPPKPPLHHTRHPFSVHNSHPNLAGLIRKPLKKITTNFTNVKVI